jgi:hypothetical protein
LYTINKRDKTTSFLAPTPQPNFLPTCLAGKKAQFALPSNADALILPCVALQPPQVRPFRVQRHTARYFRLNAYLPAVRSSQPLELPTLCTHVGQVGAGPGITCCVRACIRCLFFDSQHSLRACVCEKQGIGR